MTIRESAPKAYESLELYARTHFSGNAWNDAQFKAYLEREGFNR